MDDPPGSVFRSARVDFTLDLSDTRSRIRMPNTSTSLVPERMGGRADLPAWAAENDRRGHRLDSPVQRTRRPEGRQPIVARAALWWTRPPATWHHSTFGPLGNHDADPD